MVTKNYQNMIFYNIMTNYIHANIIIIDIIHVESKSKARLLV